MSGRRSKTIYWNLNPYKTETLDYRNLFHITLLLISSPAKAWEEILLEDRRKVLASFVYPMIGLCGLSVFVGTLLLKGWNGPESFQYAMTQCCAVAVSLFGGYFLASYLINRLSVKFFQMEDDGPLMQQFAGYALVVSFVLQVILGVLPDFNIIAILLRFYTVYIVWEGSKVLLRVSDKNRLRFTVMASVLLLLCPWLIEVLFGNLMMILN